MLKLKLTVLALVAAFTIAPVAVHAEEGGAASYALKKQNRVHFRSDAQTEQKDDISAAATADGAAQPADPAIIEPAAGDIDVQPEEDDRSSLSESLKLPRKN